MEKHCVFCQIQIKDNDNKLFCNLKCRKKYFQYKKPKKKECSFCKKLFLSVNVTSKFCSRSCANKEYWQKQRTEQKTKSVKTKLLTPREKLNQFRLQLKQIERERILKLYGEKVLQEYDKIYL